jgi:crotonobetainyl-CoA:carnitine CoA-transferase CaiB-like acyl-CoA transferase
MGLPELAGDPRFATEAARRTNFHALEDLAAEWVRNTTRADLWNVFRDLEISAGPIRPLADVLEDEHLRAREAFVKIDHAQAGELTMLAPWVRFSETPAELHHAGPAIGEHNREIYGGLLGLSDAELEELAREQVV